MIGVGVDIVEISRIAEATNRHGDRFVRRVLTPAEWDHWSSRGERMESLAGVWAAKEAVAKALGTGFTGLGLHDVVINHDAYGKPGVTLLGEALARAKAASIQEVLVTISHSGTQAIAFAIAR